MRHAILGAGGIGGLVGAALARSGAQVVLLMRAETLAQYEGSVSVDSVVLGDFTVDIPGAPRLDADVDVLWVTTKAPQLESALALAAPEQLGEATIVPLLNGIDHISLLRARYSNVAPAAIRVESERLADGRIRQSSPFLRVDLSGAQTIAAELRSAGIDVRSHEDELSLLWEKLAFLAPLALATAALDTPLGGVRGDGRYRGCQREAIAVAGAEGARLDEHALYELAANAPDGMRSSLQRDVAAGRPNELDAIAGPIERGGRHRIPVPNTEQLARLVVARTEEN